MRDIKNVNTDLIKEHLEDVLCYYEQGYLPFNATEKLITRWAEAKDNSIIKKIFGDELTVSFPVNYSMSPEEEFEQSMKIGTDSERVQLLCKIKNEWNIFRQKITKHFDRPFPRKTIEVPYRFGIEELISQKCTSEKYFCCGEKEVKIGNIINGEVKIVKGQRGEKLNALIKKVLKVYFKEQPELLEDLFEEMEKILQLESQIIQQSSVKGEIILSIDPIDYLTCSYNNNNWTSCFGPEGCYKAAALERLLSKYTFIAYMKSSEDMHYKNGNVSNKIWRTWVSANEECILVHKQNPYEIMALDSIIETFLAAKLGGDYIKETKKSCQPSYGFYYEGENGFLRKKDVEHPYICIDGEAYCLECGNSLDIEDSVFCDCCNGVVYCEDCGERMSKEDVVEMAGSYFCYDCADNHSVCTNCGDLTSDDYYTVDGETYCQDCFNEMFEICENCGEAIPIEEIHSYKGNFYCECCLEGIKEEEEQCG